MTIGKKLNEALGTLETLSGTFSVFALDTDDPQAQQMYDSCANQLKQMTQDVSARVKYVETQEPQYRRDNMVGGQQQQQQNQMSAQSISQQAFGGGQQNSGQSTLQNMSTSGNQQGNTGTSNSTTQKKSQ